MKESSGMKVVKFGGSSLADAEHYQEVIAILNADHERRIVVVSAPGKRSEKDTKVTDLLIKYATGTFMEARKALNSVIERYRAIANDFEVDEEAFRPIKQYLVDLPDFEYSSPEAQLARFKAAGERLNAELLAVVLSKVGLTSRFIDPSELGIIVDGDYNNAVVNRGTYQNIAKKRDQLLETRDLLVVPGFYGYNKNNEVATFSRGGSDITGAILANGFAAEYYENFTDVDSIYSANPKVIKNPHPIDEMTYREMRELSYAGFSVFHDEAIIPAIEGRVPIVVKNTNHPEAVGTSIVPEDEFNAKGPVTGVASSKRFAALYLHRYLLNREVGFTLKLLQILYKYNISYEHMPSGIDDLTVIFDRNQIDYTILPSLLTDIHDELQTDQLEWIDDYAIIMVVGEGMRNKVGTVDRIVSALAQNKIGVQMINQGASRISIMLGVRQSQVDDAVQYIYEEFFKKDGVESND
ncbi:aspartate kinase domain protein [Pediococcus claussenii ATCC BAA-344]|uniref:Aspartokinase n=2 Tax=Pediococcus claussenii TaxID=187452 RepID=G8PEU7_PEDCP|nr:aspartate kinase domain protein [Pediococcus claussenii ATCC BAA-344]KRN19816.1 hypothetical protein IV79_GL001104 [Pediococcus claussenii]